MGWSILKSWFVVVFIAPEIDLPILKCLWNVAQSFFLEKLHLKMPNIFRIGLVVDENEPLNVEEISKNPRFNGLEDAKINGIIEIVFTKAYSNSIGNLDFIKHINCSEITTRRS